LEQNCTKQNISRAGGEKKILRTIPTYFEISI